jgi:hypothetical protein
MVSLYNTKLNYSSGESTDVISVSQVGEKVISHKVMKTQTTS